MADVREAVIVHGRAETYRRAKCRCAPCRYAASAARRARRPLCDPEPVRAHLRTLSAAGIGYRRAAALAGVSENTVYQILTLGRRPLASTAERILAVTPDAGPAQRWRDAVGSRRMLQALQAIGWPVRDVAEQTGHSEPLLVQIVTRKRWVSPAMAEDLAAVYRQLSMAVPPESTASLRARRRAVRRCWFPPLAWEPETIDDPDGLPCLLPPIEPVARDLELLVQHVVAGHPVEPTPESRLEIVRRMPGRKLTEVAAVARCSPQRAGHLRKQVEASC